MPHDLYRRLEQAPIIPLIQADDPSVAVQTAEALAKGGLTVIEVVLRTSAAIECVTEIAASCPDVIVGAGTVLSADQAEQAITAGAAFIVSPGLDQGVVARAQKHERPVFPGVATASELQAAWNMGLRAVKFFPALLAGGPWMIKALSPAFADMRFIPTGGVSTENLKDFLALPSVLACGGSWLTPKAAIESGNFEEVTQLAKTALAIAGTVKDIS